MQRTDLNIAPFFDDFQSSKNFHRILYRPRPVQARELNQLQTILQEQVERFGRHMFEEGSMVIPGGSNFIPKQESAQVQFVGGSKYGDLVGIPDLKLRSKTNGLTAKIMRLIPVDGSKPAHMFLEYENVGTDGGRRFVTDDPCVAFHVQNDQEVLVANVNVAAAVYGQWFKVLAGVYFVRGFMVQTTSQDVIVSRGSQDRSCRVGFRVIEEIIDETKDSSLYSNAFGTPNFKAPGASRLRINLELTTKDVSDVADFDFVEIARVEKGSLQKKIDYTQYAFIEKTLAQRTYEESGDYVVNPFELNVKEHLKTNNVDGFLTEADGGDESKYVVQLRPGVGYVQGYRVQNVGIETVPVRKARDVSFVNNAVMSIDYGSYVLINNMYSAPDHDIRKVYRIQDAGAADIGTFRVRSVKKDGSSWRLYIFDLNFNSGKGWTQAKKIAFTDASNNFKADLVQSVLFEGSKASLVFPLPYSGVQTLKQNGATDTTYSVVRSFNVTTNGSGVATVSLGANEVFASVNSSDFIVALTGATNAGTVFDVSGAGVLTLGGTPVGRTLTVNLGAGQASKEIKVIAPVIKMTLTEKPKTLTQLVEQVTMASEKLKKLSKADVVEIKQIINTANGNNVTSSFTLDDGQRSAWYEPGAIQTSDGANVSGTFEVTYTYYEHGVGDYFSVDSYGGLSRGKIPTIQVGSSKLQLADCLDFRPVKDGSGNFAANGVFGDIPKPSESARLDLFRFMNRCDSVYVDSDGLFGVAQGVPADSPTYPDVPNNAMRLYDLFVPAYTPSAEAIRIQAIDNRRYTMRDIGRLEKRIENVEYYTTLNALESKVDRTQVIDPITGNDRFKNGFAVDGFSDFRLADLADPEYRAAMDFEGAMLNPPFVDNASEFSIISGANHSVRRDLALKAFTEVVAVDQPFATRTININPYAVFTWVGRVELSPASDFWKDVVYLPPKYVNVTVDQTGGARAGTVVTTSAGGWRGGWRTHTTTTTTTTVNESWSQSQQDNVTGVEVIPWMRSIPVRFQVQGLRPFTQIYPFWDGVKISSVCKQDGKNFGDPIVTDATGSAAGVYQVPNRPDFRFPTGRSLFRFSDSPTDSRDPNSNFTSGEAAFTSGGTLESRQVTVTNTRTLTASTRTTTSTWREDPIAQTFFVTTQGGAYLSKVDIFFATKAVNVPVKLQLRTVENGLPTNDVMPFGEVVLPASQVRVSGDGSVATSFTFPDPVYVRENVEYAVVLLADTQEYNVFIAQMGQNVIGQNMALAKQPHIGVFLTSANGSTWTANQMQDMKFRVWSCEFNTSDTTVNFGTLKPAQQVMVEFNGIKTTSGSKVVNVRVLSHGFKVGDTLSLSGAKGGNGYTDEDLVGTFTAANVTLDTFDITLAKNATASGNIGAETGRVVPNCPYSDLFINFEHMVLPGTEIVWEMRYRQQGNRAMSDWNRIGVRADMRVTSEGVLVNANDIEVRATMKTTKKNLSPCIDMMLASAALRSFRVNNDVNTPAFSYVTRQIRFDNPSTSARFYVGASLPGNSKLRLFYKLITGADDDLSKKAWVELASTKPMNNLMQFQEFEYQLQGVGSFIGYKVKLVMTSDDAVNYPILSDFRSIALA